MLTRDEYRYWVDYAHDNYVGMPKTLYQDETQLMHRATLGKQLMRLKKYLPAIELFKTVVDVKIDEADPEFRDVIEQKVWCLQELAMAIWRETGNAGEALTYAEKAWNLANETSCAFYHVVRAEIWRTWLAFLSFSGKTNQALKEADIRIETTFTGQGKNNSFLAYAYHFKASLAKEEENLEQAVAYLKQAVSHTLSAEDFAGLLADLSQKRQNDSKAVFEELESNAFEREIVWDNENQYSE